MYKFKKECKIEILNKYKIINLAKEIGVTRQTLSLIINGKRCKYSEAYTITKKIDITKEVEDFFIEI